MKKLINRTKEDIEIFRKFFYEYFKQHKNKCCIKEACIVFIPLIVLLIIFFQYEKNEIKEISHNFIKLIGFAIWAYTTIIFILLLLFVLSVGFHKYFRLYNKILCIFLKIVFIPIIFLNFVEQEYNPKLNDNLLFSGIIIIYINLISIFIFIILILKYCIFKSLIIPIKIFIIIGIATILSDCISYFIYKKLLNFINKGYNNKNYFVDDKSKDKYLVYTRKYLNNLVFRAKLLMLILLFFSIVLFPTENNEFNSNLINVISCVAMAMLYFDKRKEWNLDEIED